MTSRTLTPARPRFGRLAVCLAATVALLAMASCSGDDDRADGSAVAESPTDAASSSGDDVAEGGLDIELVGWSPPPYPDDAESVAVGFGGSDYVAVHIRVCLGADADLAPHLVGLVTVGDTDGEPFNAGHFQGAPVASPSGFEAPAPGECSEGWVYPAFDAGLEPATAVWIDAEGTQGATGRGRSASPTRPARCRCSATSGRWARRGTWPTGRVGPFTASPSPAPTIRWRRLASSIQERRGS